MVSELIENEKRIVSLARIRGSISKPDIAAKDGVGCGWATAHKLVQRLEKQNILETAGTAKRKGRYGKSARLYRLNPTRNCALGLDIEKAITTAVLVTLGGEVVWQQEQPTPDLKSPAGIVGFVRRVIKGALKANENNDRHIAGIGIGAPLPGGIQYIPERLYKRITEQALKPTGYGAVVENNVSAYTDYIRYMEHLPDFALVSIRTGVGGGLVINNRLHRGMGYAAELGHLDTGGRRVCSCGRTGCLESEISLPALAEYFQSQGGKKGVNAREIFRLDAEGDAAAVKTADHAAEKLAAGLHNLRVVADMPLYLIAGSFGPQGKRLTRRLVQNDKSLRGKTRYIDIGAGDFFLASAHLIHRRYLLRNES